MNREHVVAILTSQAGMVLYVFAVFTIFSQTDHRDVGQLFVPLLLACVGGLGALVLGYTSEIGLGGALSLKLADLVAHIKRSRHIIEIAKKETHTRNDTLRTGLFPLSVLGLIFVTSLILAWDIDNLHPVDPSVLHSLIHELDFLQHRISSDPLAYVGNVVLDMMVLIFLTGAAPSMALPYFRKFKITGVNTGPFHTSFIFTMIGLVGGLSLVLTFARLVLNIMTGSQAVFYYDFVFPIMLGLSIHYTTGAFLGRDKAEDMVEAQLETGSGKRVARGTINIQ